MPIRPPWRFGLIATAALLALAGAACADRPTPLGVSPAPAPGAPILNLTVRPVRRFWTGAASTDWFTSLNWSGSRVPTAFDTAVIPATGVFNFPVLTANTNIGGVEVADSAVLDLSGFELIASGDVHTGPTPGSGIVDSYGGVLRLTGIARTIHGRFPAVSVEGTYSLNGAYWGRMQQSVQGGRFTTQGFTMTFTP